MMRPTPTTLLALLLASGVCLTSLADTTKLRPTELLK